MHTEEKKHLVDVVSKLEWRYATQKFDASRKIDQSTWQAIERALVLTPSSWGLQTWKFVVVTDSKVKDELVSASYGQKQVQDCSHVVVICRLAQLTPEYIDDFVNYSARVRKVSVDDLARDRELMMQMHNRMDAEQAAQWMDKQCYIALGNLMTTASILEIDTCPMEGFSSAKYDQILGLDKSGCHSVVVCALGYRSKDDKKANLPKIRFPHEKVIVRI